MPQPFPHRIDGGVRRIVTGVDPHGRAVVVADECVTGDPSALLLWAGDAPPVVGDAARPATQGWWPPPGGVRVSLSTRRPDRETQAPRAAHLPEIDDAAGFHASRSTDIVIVVSGRIWLELDDGVEIALDAGDVLVQNGTRHRWRNHGEEWPIIAVVIIGARDGDGAPPQNG